MNARQIGIALAASGALLAAVTHAAPPRSPLQGTWTLVAADVLHPDGTRTRDYGPSPRGRMIVDGRGRYSSQIFDSERPRFAAGDKTKGTPAEYRAAVLGESTHFGTVELGSTPGTIVYHIEGASFANWIGTTRTADSVARDGGNEMTNTSSARPNGDRPITVWKRVE